MTSPMVAIVDYGLGNLYSVKRACHVAGLDAKLASTAKELESVDGVVLPGVGAFGDAMRTLSERGLAEGIQRAEKAGLPIMGVCLGVQLLMSHSEEFGSHQGLGIVPGKVVKLCEPTEEGRKLKIPQVGWNRLIANRPWAGTALAELPSDAQMYFVHSYCVQPEDPSVILATAKYGGLNVCAAIQRGSLFACQFHPERSGPQGLSIYRAWARMVRGQKEKARP